MTSLDAYSPLEQLLVFQSLAAYGTSAESFKKISESLRQSNALDDVDRRADDRFSPDGLRALYLSLLKEEASRDLENALDREGSQANGEGSRSPRKRKAPSPSLPTVEEAQRHAHLVPQMVARLYAQYRDEIIREIRVEEQEYDKLVQQLKRETTEPETLLKDGKAKHAADNEVDTPADDAANRGNDISKSELAVAQDESLKANDQLDSAVPAPEPKLGQTTSSVDTAFKFDGDQSGQAETHSAVWLKEISAPTEQTSEPPPALQVQPSAEATSSHGPGQTPQSSAVEPSSDSLRPPGPSQNIGPGDTSRASPVRTDSAKQSSPRRGVTPHVEFAPGSLSVQETQGSSRRRSPGRSSARASPVPATASDQSRPHSAQHTGIIQSETPVLATASPVPSSHSRTAHAASASRYFSPQPQTQPHPAPHRPGGVILPPFQVSPQVPSASQSQSAQKQSTTPVPPPKPPKKAVELSGPSFVFEAAAQSQTPPPHTPAPLPHQTRLLKPSVTVSPGSSTAWKVPSADNIKKEDQPRGYSPISDTELSPGTAERRSTPQRQKARLGGLKSLQAEEQHDSSKEETLSTRGARRGGRWTRSSQSPAARGTPAANRTRSASLASQVETAPLTTRAGRRRIKDEAGADRGTPDDTTSAPRQTRGTAAVATANKRKRGAEEDDELTSPIPASVPGGGGGAGGPRSNTVVAFRNFPKMAQPILNNIASHKHASIFASHVTVAGYDEIVRRPQDLKSIRAAITAGARAVHAATASMDSLASASSPGGAGGSATPVPGSTPSAPAAAQQASAGGTGTLTLPYSEDLVPPRAIVNGAQLEQEVMRMLANAVMFNSGDGGTVSDAREMFVAAEQSIAAWRSAERERAPEPGSSARDKDGGGGRGRVDDDADELADDGTGGAAAGGASKRRRLA